MQVIAMCLLAAVMAPSPSAEPAAGGSEPDGTPPRVRVVTTRGEGENATDLYDWLVVRLLEEGYAVAGDDGAEIDLTIWPVRSGWSVRAHGESTETFTVSIGDDEDVARLELLHRAVDALEQVEPRDRPDAATSKAFAIDLAPTFEAEQQNAIASKLALAVLAGGGSLAPDRASAQFVVCAAPGAGGTHVEIAKADAMCPVPSGNDAQPPAGEHTRELVATALLANPETVPDAMVAEQARESERAPRSESRMPDLNANRRVWKTSKLKIRGGASAGVVGRITEANAVVAASMWFGREPGFSLWLDLQLWPGRQRHGLRVFETVPAIGVRLRPLTDGRFSLDLGALLGMQTHSYRFDRDGFRDKGIAGDWSVEGAVGFSVRMWREHELMVLFRAGRSGRERQHTFEQSLIWQRAAWRIGATIGITFGRVLRP